MKIGEWMDQARGISWSEAVTLVAEVRGLPEYFNVIILEEEELAEAERRRLEAMRQRLVKGEPMAYILGRKEFFRREWKVSPAVLIPRPETEVLVEATIDEIGERDRRLIEWMMADDNHSRTNERVLVAEVGVGSGCLIGSVAEDGMTLETDFVACDISEEALMVAEQNLKGDDVTLFRGDLLENWQLWRDGKVQKDAGVKYGYFDVILANLPYVDREWEWNSPGLSYEPDMALFARNGGLALMIELLQQARGRLKPGGVVMLEMDKSQQKTMADIMIMMGYAKIVKISDYVLAAYRN